MIDDVVVTTLCIEVVYDKDGRLISFETPKDLPLIDVTMDRDYLHTYVWGIGVLPQWQQWLNDPNMAAWNRRKDDV